MGQDVTTNGENAEVREQVAAVLYAKAEKHLNARLTASLRAIAESGCEGDEPDVYCHLDGVPEWTGACPASLVTPWRWHGPKRLLLAETRRASDAVDWCS